MGQGVVLRIGGCPVPIPLGAQSWALETNLTMRFQVTFGSKLLNILSNSCGVNTATLLKYIWPILSLCMKWLTYSSPYFHEVFLSLKRSWFKYFDVTLQCLKFLYFPFLKKCFETFMEGLHDTTANQAANLQFEIQHVITIF